MTYHSNEIHIDNGFWDEDSTKTGQFDFNAEEYSVNQSKMATDLAELTGVKLLPTKPKFCKYDAHICLNGDERQVAGTATFVPGRPVWYEANGIIELKYREVNYTSFPTTVLDTDKVGALKSVSRDMGLPCWVFFRFLDGDYTYKVEPNHTFKIEMGQNYKTAPDMPYERKPLSHIPVSYLKPLDKDIFKNLNTNKGGS